MVDRSSATTASSLGITTDESAREQPSAERRFDESTGGADQHQRIPEFEVTILTTRSGTAVAIVIASDREAALSAVREELLSGDLTAPPEHCTDDVQTEIWAIRELP